MMADQQLSKEEDDPTPPAMQTEKPQKIQERFGKFWGTLFVLLVLVVKVGKSLLIGLKIFKSWAFIKTGISMLLAIGFYAQLWGWPFAALFIVLLFFHEMGHIWALKHYGLSSGGPLFIPFIGAYIALKEMPKNVEIEAWVGLGGPLLGTAAATLCWAYGLYSGKQFWFAAAYTGFFLNLFNLLPVRPLDGGRAIAAISPKLWGVGILVLLFLLLHSFNPLLLIILLLAISNIWTLWKNRNNQTEAAYFSISTSAKLQIGSCYFALLFYLAIAIQLTKV